MKHVYRAFPHTNTHPFCRLLAILTHATLLIRWEVQYIHQVHTVEACREYASLALCLGLCSHYTRYYSIEYGHTPRYYGTYIHTCAYLVPIMLHMSWLYMQSGVVMLCNSFCCCMGNLQYNYTLMLIQVWYLHCTQVHTVSILSPLDMSMELYSYDMQYSLLLVWVLYYNCTLLKPWCLHVCTYLATYSAVYGLICNRFCCQSGQW